MTIKRTLPLFATATLVATLAGCSGQGNYTREGVSMAKERMSFLKSATEWELARQAFLAGDLEKALRKVDVSLEINDTVVKSHVLKGRILIEMGNIGNALESLQTAVTLDPGEPDAHYYLGIVYERISEPELAREHFEIACEYDDYNPSYAVAAAEMMIDLNRIDDAKGYLSSIPMSANNAGIRQTLGHIALIEGEPEAAVKLFEQARLLAPDDSGIAEDLLHAQIQAGAWREAERSVAVLLKKPENKDREDLRILHAKTLMNTGRPVEARSIYQSMVSRDEGRSDVDAWVGLANASYMVGDLRTVRKAASRIVSLSPDSHDGFMLYAMYHREQGDFKSALSSIETAISKQPKSADMFAFRAMILGDMGRSQDALESITYAAKLEPRNPQYARMLTDFTRGAYATVPTDGQ
ncbi:MAG: tetratricopeptide repeat protein [Phycisphaerales bacterium JB052]